jgi:transcriptional regulator with XRE-family HTH domain
MEARRSTRDRIVSYAEAIKREGGTYKDAAEKLDISPSTLRRYRKGKTTPRADVEQKMNTGGKLTQLEQNAPTPGDDVVPEDLTAHTDDVMERPQFAAEFASNLGAGDILNMQDLDDPIEVTVTARKYEFEDGTFQWVIGGTQDVGELTETREKTFTVGSSQDARHLAGMVNPWLAENNIIDSPEALPSQRGMRKVS